MKNNYNKRGNDLRARKRIKNLPKYDPGKRIINSGRQTNYGIDTSEFESIPGLDMSQAVAAKRASIIPTAISSFGSNASSIASNYALNFTTKAAASAANANLLKNAGYTLNNGIWAKDGIEYATQAAAENAFKEAGGTGLKSAGWSTMGNALNVIGGIVGAAQLGTGLYNQWNSAPTAEELLNASGKIRLSKNGVMYEQYAGFNDDQFSKYLDASNLSNTVSNTAVGAGAGFSVGSLAGGPLIGGLVGAGLGVGLSLIAGDHARDVYNKNKKGVNTMFAGYNRQSESVAGSVGSRNIYNYTHRVPSGLGFNLGKPEENKWSEDGQISGKTGSLVGKGESIINFDEGKATYIDKGIKGVDNQESTVTPGDRNAIAGNLIDPMTNVSYADQAAPYTKTVERMNDILESTDSTTNTGKLNSMLAQRAKDYAFRNLEDIIARQGIHLQALEYLNNTRMFNKGKSLPKFDPGKGDIYKAAGAHLLSGIFPIMQYFDYKGSKPQAYPSYAPNNGFRLGGAIMASRHDDPYEDRLAIKKANREAIYAINHSPLSQGLRMALFAALNSNYMNALADRIAKSRELNNQYAGEYANYLLTGGSNDQRIRYASNAQRNQDLLKAVATRQLGMETALKGMQSEWQAFAQDMQKYDWFRQAMGFNDRQLELWGDQNDLEWYKARQGLYNNNNDAKPGHNIPLQSGLVMNRFGQLGYYDVNSGQFSRIPGRSYNRNGIKIEEA